jgi:L-threonylcarbamoyladenylate synthase
MRVNTKEEFLLNKEEHIESLKDGKLFIYPTDTVYGIGCDATNEIAVYNLRNAKKRPTRPLSIIAPSKEWIKENFIIDDKARDWCNKLPGPYTLVLKLKNKNAISPNISDTGTIGIRIPNHWISDVVSNFGKPIITSSANITGKNFMTSIEDLDDELKVKIDFFIDEGEINGTPSKIIRLDKDEVEVLTRD